MEEHKKKQTTEPVPTNKTNNRYYSVCGHRLYYIALSILVIILSVAAGIGLAKLFYIYAIHWDWLYSDMEHIGDPSQLNYIIDFLGATMGILLGFIIEMLFLSRLKHLKKYEALLSVIRVELRATVFTLKDYLEKNLSGNHEDKWKNGTWQIESTILEGLFKSTDNMSILLNVPRFFWWTKRWKITDATWEVCRELGSVNKALKLEYEVWNNGQSIKDVADKTVSRIDKLLKKICVFAQITDKKFYEEIKDVHT